ncbi:MAG TPA: cytochrome c oxidase assembly protein [Xanthobacteraceae bacterium]|nr:cytochrome c oxidase assembly protein [Xanthobacteraceae bacterium]
MPAALIPLTIVASGMLLWWLCRSHDSILPFFAPWEFSWVEFLAAWLSIWWYVRGLALIPANERPSSVRQMAFLIGILLIYAVLETRFEYLAQHQFFFNRIQHVAMHHVGPLLIALAWPGAAIRRGMPSLLRKLVDHPIVIGVVHVVQQPVLAAVLFVGLFFFWLIPSVHFRAMLDSDLYALMNWSMIVDGIFFWCLVLDPRASPPARVSFGARAALAVAVMFPQIVGGALIAFNPHDLYPYYDLCGRIYPGMSALYDQTVGSLIIWIPPAMMSVLALLLVLNALRRTEEGQPDNEDENMHGTVIQSSRWTG